MGDAETEISVSVDFPPTGGELLHKRRMVLVTYSAMVVGGGLGMLVPAWLGVHALELCLVCLGLSMGAVELFRRQWFLSVGWRRVADLVQSGRSPLEAYAITERMRPPRVVFESVSGGVCALLVVLMYRESVDGYSVAFVVCLAVFALLQDIWAVWRTPKLKQSIRVEAVAILMVDRYPLEGFPAISGSLCFLLLGIATMHFPIFFFPFILGALVIGVIFRRARNRKWKRESIPVEARLNRMILEAVEAR